MDRAQVEFLGLVAYASLAAFEQTAAASAAAPQVSDKLVLARIAAQRFTHVQALERELQQAGTTLDQAVQPFVVAVDDLNRHTAPLVWGEQLAKLCVVGGLVHDFAEQVSPHLDQRLASILNGTIDDGELAHEPGRMLAQALQDEPEVQGRLALFSRRLLGECMSQAQRIAAARPELTGLVTGHQDGAGDDLAAVSEMFGRLVSGHNTRVEQLGL